jgi:hypothetical protein
MVASHSGSTATANAYDAVLIRNLCHQDHKSASLNTGQTVKG